jgi:hypothetical protein
MQNSYINVHTFDGKLKGMFCPNTPLYNNTEKHKSFSDLILLLTNNDAINTVKIMINDLDKTTNGNIQIENDLDASNILMDILKSTEISDVILCLNEQLSDVNKLGSCPSGRCTRLLQIWSAFSRNK